MTGESKPAGRASFRLQDPSVATVAVVVAGLAAVCSVVLFRIWTVADRTLGDLALIELEVRRAFSSDSPLLGAYSRFGWRHPGPVAFYLLALPYRAFGAGAQALATGALLLNTGWLIWTLSVVRRRGPAAVAAFGSALLLLVTGFGVDGLGDAWNVSLTLVPFAALMISCWAVLCADRRARLLAVASYVFIVQTHVGAGVVATPVAIVTLTSILLLPDLRDRHRLTRRDIPVAVTVFLVAVGPLLIDAIRNPPGNLPRLLRWSLDNDAEVIGLTKATRILGRSSSLTFPLQPEPPRFLLWVETDSLGFLPGISVACLLALGTLAWRRGRREEMLLSVVLATAWVSGLVAARSIPEPPEWWLVEWLQPLGWITVAATGLLLWRLLIRPIVGGSTAAQVVGIGLVTVAAAVAVVIEVRTISEFDRRAVVAVEPVGQLVDAVQDSAVGGSVRIDTVDPDFSAENLLAGVVNESSRQGVDVCVHPRLAYKFPDDNVCSGDEDVVLLLRTETTAAAPPDQYEPIAIYDPLTPDVRRRADATRASLADALRADGRGDLIGTLDTPLAADAVLAARPPIAVARDDLQWLDAVRERPGLRFGLYRRSS